MNAPFKSRFRDYADEEPNGADNKIIDQKGNSIHPSCPKEKRRNIGNRFFQFLQMIASIKTQFSSPARGHTYFQISVPAKRERRAVKW